MVSSRANLEKPLSTLAVVTGKLRAIRYRACAGHEHLSISLDKPQRDWLFLYAEQVLEVTIATAQLPCLCRQTRNAQPGDKHTSPHQHILRCPATGKRCRRSSWENECLGPYSHNQPIQSNIVELNIHCVPAREMIFLPSSVI